MKTVYAILPGREIFNACRNDFLYDVAVRYKDRWWHQEFDELRALILEWFTEQFEHHTGGHYSQLRKSVISRGFLNPIMVTSGKPLRREPWMLPPWAADYKYLCEQNGGSRLALAQELDMEIPCIVNGEAPGRELKNLSEVKECFGDRSYNVYRHRDWGIVSSPRNLLHLGHFNMQQNKYAVRHSKDEVIRRANKWLRERGYE